MLKDGHKLKLESVSARIVLVLCCKKIIYNYTPKREVDRVAMLWFNFILGSNFLFFCFKLIIMLLSYHTQKQKKRKFGPGNKPQRDIYLALLTDPEGDSCFSIYQISWIKLKKVTFCQVKTSVSRSFVFNFQTLRGFCQVHFTVLLKIQHINNILPTSEHRQAKVRRFLDICLYDCFIYFVFRKCLETRRHLGSGRKTVNSQGYSELREPNKTRENCSSLIW